MRVRPIGTPNRIRDGFPQQRTRRESKALPVNHRGRWRLLWCLDRKFRRPSARGRQPPQPTRYLLPIARGVDLLVRSTPYLNTHILRAPTRRTPECAYVIYYRLCHHKNAFIAAGTPHHQRRHHQRRQRGRGQCVLHLAININTATAAAMATFAEDCLLPESFFESRKALFKSINTYAKPQGYTFVIQRSVL